MATTVEAGFREFRSRLTPLSGETEAARKHRASVEASLKSNFEITRFFRTGSFGNGTSIRSYSDVDYFASIPTNNLKQNSQSTLREVKDVLAGRFPGTGVAVRTPAVLVPFGTEASESTEVVPADFIKSSDGNLVYEIPDGSGGWKRSSPDAHNSYVAGVNGNLNSKVKPLIRFLKAWKYYKNVPISSFYLEMRVAKYASKEAAIIYSIDVKAILQLLWDNQLAAVQDPMGVSGYIYPCSSDAKKDTALSKLYTALRRAENAREAESDGKTSTAFGWWDLLFDGTFQPMGSVQDHRSWWRGGTGAARTSRGQCPKT